MTLTNPENKVIATFGNLNIVWLNKNHIWIPAIRIFNFYLSKSILFKCYQEVPWALIMQRV